MHQYIVFICPIYYPNGGWRDILRDGEDGEGGVRSFVTIDEAHLAAEKNIDRGYDGEPYSTYHIVDLLSGAIVEET